MSRIFKRHDRDGVYYYDGRYEGKGIMSLQTTRKSEALRLKSKLDALPSEEVNPRAPVENESRLQKFMINYLNWSKATKAHATWTHEEWCLRELSNWWQAKFIRDLTQQSADAYIASLVNERQLRPPTVNSIVRTLRSVFNKGVEWEVVSFNPWSKKQYVAWDEPLPNAVTEKELDAFFKVVSEKNPNLVDHFLALLGTGVRRGELQRIQWQDIDFESGKVTIPKTKGHKPRVVFFDKFLLDRLTHKRTQGNQTVPFPLSPDWWTHSFKDRMRDAGIESHKLHDLRKTFTSIMSTQVEALQLARYLGHSSPDTTYNYYTAQEAEKVSKQGTALKQIVGSIESNLKGTQLDPTEPPKGKIIPLYPDKKKKQSTNAG